jgi:2-polyprenyl-3-methyl-5-hydroxy-6-metoxy-1,4-benzoquinol methylase/Zn ribbon nucleic-acid-binding protein
VEHIKLAHCPLCNAENHKKFLTVKDHMITKESFNILECSACGFHFTNPRPSLLNIGHYYKSEDYVSHSSSKKGFINSIYNLIRNYTIKQKVNLLKSLSKKTEILDIGAGTGHFLNACKTNGFSVLGLEPDEDAVNFAKNNFQLDLKPLATLYELESNSKDFISMWHVLEHVYNLKQDFTEIVRVLKDDGFLIIAVPNMESYDAKIYKENWAAYDVPRHLYHFRKLDIEQLSKKYELKLIDVKGMKFDSFYVSMLSEKYIGGSILKAFLNGLKSNLKSNKGGYSSQIYILSKN